MVWYSLLPSYLTVVEKWIIRIAIFCAILNIAPWLLAILADILLYVFRQIWHWIPIWGGRAQGKSRPRAPNLDVTRRRTLSLAGMMGSGDSRRVGQEGLRRRHGRNGSGNNFDDDHDDDDAAVSEALPSIDPDITA